MPKGRADTGSGGEHGRNAGHHRHLDIAPRWLARFDRLEHRAGHGEHAWIAGGRDGNRLPRCGKLESLAGAGQLLAIVGRVAKLAGALGHAGEIGRIADEVAGGGERLRREWRDKLGRAGTEADNGEATGHNGFLSPGTSTTAK